MTLPMSGCATRTSMRVGPSRSISRTSPASTRAFTTNSIVSRMRVSALSGVRVIFVGQFAHKKPDLSRYSHARHLRRRCFGLAGSGLILRRLLDQPPHGISRLRAFADPVLHAIALEINFRGLARRIVRTKVLQVSTGALRLLLFDYDAIRGTL